MLDLWETKTHRDEIQRRMEVHRELWSGPLGRARCRTFWREHGRFCDRCGWYRPFLWFKRQLEVHHVHYRDDTGYESDDTLRALCSRCHDHVHAIHRRTYIWGRSYWRRDLWPYEHLERVTDRCIRASWWRRALRRKP